MNNNNTQSRSGTRCLVSLTLALGVSLGVVGCSTHPTTLTGSNGAGESSASAARALVDVAAVWATHPMPPCPRVVIGNATASPGLVLPDDASVARQLTGVRSPGSVEWVRAKLGWVTQALSVTRADVIDNKGAADANSVEVKGFERYVGHVKDELVVGHDIAADVDGDYPEGCR